MGRLWISDRESIQGHFALVHPVPMDSLTEFHQPLQVQSHLEMPGILVQLGHIQRT